MNISINGLWTNSCNFIRGKIADGFTPLEKKVAVFAIAYIALATLCFLVYHCFSQKKNHDSLDDRHSFRTVNLTGKQSAKRSPAPYRAKEAEAKRPDEITENVNPSSPESIAVANADQLRTIVNQYEMETLNRVGQWRDLYLDATGRLQGINGPDGGAIWLADHPTKKEDLHCVTIIMHKVDWDPGKGPAFTWNPQKIVGIPSKILDIVNITVQELNQLANGAFVSAKADHAVDILGGFSWLTYFSDTTNYSSACLLSKTDSLTKSPAQSPKVDAQPPLGLPDADGDYDHGDPFTTDEAVSLPLTGPNPAVAKTGQIVLDDDLFDNRTLPKKKTIQERMKKNCEDALSQQLHETEKGFSIATDVVPGTLDLKSITGMDLKNLSLTSGKKVNAAFADIGFASCQGRRDTMEDADLVASGRVNLKAGSQPFDLFGVFDGHGGNAASIYMKEHLVEYLTKELETCCQDGFTEEGIFRSLKESFKKLDADYTGGDGTTATVALILDGRLYVANVGDSRTILVKGEGAAVQASEDAKPQMDRYKAKIEKLGGVVYRGRVNGQLAVARAIGDKHIMGNNACLVSPNPKITSYPLDFAYAVLACDGLYDVASTNEVGTAVKAMHDNNENAEEMAKRLVYSAIQRGSKDNVSVIVIKR